MDQVFQEEQAHLTQTYGKLLQIEQESAQALKARLDDAAGDRKSMTEELTWDFSGDVNT